MDIGYLISIEGRFWKLTLTSRKHNTKGITVINKEKCVFGKPSIFKKYYSKKNINMWENIKKMTALALRNLELQIGTLHVCTKCQKMHEVHKTSW